MQRSQVSREADATQPLARALLNRSARGASPCGAPGMQRGGDDGCPAQRGADRTHSPKGRDGRTAYQKRRRRTRLGSPVEQRGVKEAHQGCLPRRTRARLFLFDVERPPRIGQGEHESVAGSGTSNVTSGCTSDGSCAPVAASEHPSAQRATS
ncbi:hypothetical protein T492DRAFT_1129282 [Pavlovales sp. CCMP2436]|nr:hypothetical protein T492DRAFT_1129282 [Pavlovales sp. CCMP2436]